MRAQVYTHPRIPSAPWRPRNVDATPMDWGEITTLGVIVTVSMNSVPESYVNIAKTNRALTDENAPENVAVPYDTD